MPRPRRRNPWTSTGEVLIWVLFAALLFPAGFAGWAVGHYTSLGGGKSSGVRTVTVSAPSQPTTAATSTTSSTASTSTSTSTSTTSGGSSGNAAAGKAVFASNTCATCHTFQPAGATGTIGPDLDTHPASDAKDAKMPLPAFIKQSIVDPDAYIAKGYSKGIMPTTFGKQLSKTQLNDLVAFILSGTKS